MKKAGVQNAADTVRVVLGLGSNRSFGGSEGELSPCELLSAACSRLSSVLSDLKLSSVYITKPMYVTEQPDFYNMAVLGWYSGTPESLLEKTQTIEAELGRDRSREYRNGPRSLDIDIELFGTSHISTETLVIPHPRILERAFVLVPVLEILDESADKADRVLFSEALAKTGTQGVQKYGRLNS